jgi:asparagine synthase (glutamine-hydrolysing)
MCGLAGVLNLYEAEPVEYDTMRRMLSQLHHRGPDEGGIYVDGRIGLSHARLSIIDLAGGQQPISNEDGTKWIVYNGEVFNYEALRPALMARGHQFTTQTDTEVILHLYEERGPACLDELNGQFAFAIWDTAANTLFLARDRVGIRPLFYTIDRDRLIFASEIKAILAAPQVRAAIDPVALDQVFAYWSPREPRTIFKDIYQLPPGHYALVQDGEMQIRRYWQLTFPEQEMGKRKERPLADYLAEFHDLLVDAARIRLRADVPVGAYLSGGLDSSTTTAIIRRYTSARLATFSIAFDDPDFDESVYQQRMAAELGTDHAITSIADADIGQLFPDVIWHTETPILRTAPAPLYKLASLVREHGYKVVVTGEGADEFLAGYNIFKETMVRRFWARQPNSMIRPLLLRRLYPYISSLAGGGDGYLAAFFRRNLADVDAPDYSHQLRWQNTSRAKRFFSDELQASLPPAEPLSLPFGFERWHPLHRAQYLEATIFLPQYLLSSQGDRMSMAHAVEGRYPFLDHRLIEFCNHLPPTMKLFGLQEKFLLKKLGQRYLPDEIWRRPKRPYRAPIHNCFFSPQPPDYVRELLSPAYVRKVGLFKETAVTRLVQKIERGLPISETDDMALAGILSTQLIHHLFIDNYQLPTANPAQNNLKYFGIKEPV